MLPPEEERFKINTEGLTDHILSGVTKLFNNGYETVNPGLIALAKEYIKGVSAHTLIRGFIKNSHMYWDNIKQRDESFFINNAGAVFDGLPTDTVNLFRDLIVTKDKNGKSVISDAFKVTLWEFFDSLVKISIKYIIKNNYDKHVKDVDYHVKYWQIKIN